MIAWNLATRGGSFLRISNCIILMFSVVKKCQFLGTNFLFTIQIQKLLTYCFFAGIRWHPLLFLPLFFFYVYLGCHQLSAAGIHTSAFRCIQVSFPGTWVPHVLNCSGHDGNWDCSWFTMTCPAGRFLTLFDLASDHCAICTPLKKARIMPESCQNLMDDFLAGFDMYHVANTTCRSWTFSKPDLVRLILSFCNSSSLVFSFDTGTDAANFGSLAVHGSTQRSSNFDS